MQKFSSILALIGISLTASAQTGAPAKGPIYAGPACDSGCTAVITKYSDFYVGSVAKSFRVCTHDGFAAVISVDGVEVKIPSTTFGVRGCVDVSGQRITLLDGQIGVGPLPN